MRNKRILPYKIMNDKLMFCLFKMRFVAKKCFENFVLMCCNIVAAPWWHSCLLRKETTVEVTFYTDNCVKVV